MTRLCDVLSRNPRPMSRPNSAKVVVGYLRRGVHSPGERTAEVNPCSAILPSARMRVAAVAVRRRNSQLRFCGCSTYRRRERLAAKRHGSTEGFESEGGELDRR